MAGHTHRDFFAAFLERLRLPVGRPQLRTLAAVSIFESSQGNNRWNNPLACTQLWPGAVPYNTFGEAQNHVWIYPTFDAGVRATAELFAGSHWADVRTHLADTKTTRGPMLDAFTRAYSWADVDFRGLFTVEQIDARLAHPLLGPK